jgi:hypothetical protein
VAPVWPGAADGFSPAFWASDQASNSANAASVKSSGTPPLPLGELLSGRCGADACFINSPARVVRETQVGSGEG